MKNLKTKLQWEVYWQVNSHSRGKVSAQVDNHISEQLAVNQVYWQVREHIKDEMNNEKS